MKAKTVFACLAAAVLACSLALLGGCGGNSAQTLSNAASKEGSLEKLVFALDYVPNTNHTGIYVAIDKGYYADAGLDVKVVQPPDDGADAMVASGQAQFGMSFQDVMANYLGTDNPLPVTAVAAVVQHNTSGIISRKGDGIEHPGALTGKRYATWDMDVEKAMLEKIVNADGGDWSQVQLIPANSTDEVAGLQAGMYDAAWCYEAWAGQNAALQGFESDYFSLREADETFDYYTPVIIANDRFLEEQPDTAKAFLAATKQGYEYAAKHAEESAEILVKYAPETDSDLALASQKYLANRYVDDAPYWGYIDPVRWNRFYGWVNDEDLVPADIPENAGFSNDYLPGK